MVKNIFAGGIQQSLSSHGNRDAVGPRSCQALRHLGVGGVFSGADNQPAGKTNTADSQTFICGVLIAVDGGGIGHGRVGVYPNGIRVFVSRHQRV